MDSRGGRMGDKLSLIKCKERRTKENLLQQKTLKTTKTSNDPRGFIVLQTTLTVESLWLDISIAPFIAFFWALTCHGL